MKTFTLPYRVSQDVVAGSFLQARPPLMAAFLNLIKYPFAKCFIIGLVLQITFSNNTLAQDACKREMNAVAMVNDVPFQLRPDWAFTGKLLTEQGAMDGSRPNRNVVNLTLYGANYTTPTGEWFSEQIELQVSFNASTLDTTPVCAVEMHYKGNVYSFIQGAGQLKVTQLTWSADHRSFTFSGNFDFTMRNWAYAQTGSPDVRLTGKLKQVNITVPGWLLAKM